MIRADTPAEAVPPRLHLLCGSTAWFHVTPPRSTPLTALPHAELTGSAVQALLQWLLDQGALYSTELRLCGSGQHRGIWLGLTGHGATRQHAKEVSHEGQLMLSSFFRLNQWKAAQDSPARLPRWQAGLRFTPGRTRLESHHALLPQRACVVQLAQRGAPMLLQIRMQARGVSTHVYSEAAQLRRELDTRDGPRQPSPLVHHQRGMIEQLEDDAADLTATVSLYAARAPSPMRLRKFAHAFPGSRLLAPWGHAPTPAPASVRLLRDALALMAGKEAP